MSIALFEQNREGFSQRPLSFCFEENRKGRERRVIWHLRSHQSKGEFQALLPFRPGRSVRYHHYIITSNFRFKRGCKKKQEVTSYAANPTILLGQPIVPSVDQPFPLPFE